MNVERVEMMVKEIDLLIPEDILYEAANQTVIQLPSKECAATKTLLM